MKKNPLPLLVWALFVAASLVGCDDYQTYTELKEKEETAIKDFLKDGGVDGRPIKVITEAQFYAQDTTTNVELNEYVHFTEGDFTGAYMQIIRKGEGRPQRKGESRGYLARYYEMNIADRDTMTLNLYDLRPEEMTIKRVNDTFSGTFTYGHMLAVYGSSSSAMSMYNPYSYTSSASGSATLPTGWLLPFRFITPGRPNDKAAKVRLILPHDTGTSSAQTTIYAAFYEITIMPEP